MIGLINYEHKIRFLYLFQSFIAIIIGGLIYVVYRTDALLMFKWFYILHLDNIVNAVRSIHFSINDYFKFTLPDALWVYSYIMMMGFIWNQPIKKTNIFWFLFLPIVGLISEFLQLFGFPGTFDVIDIFFILVAILIAFFQIQCFNLTINNKI